MLCPDEVVDDVRAGRVAPGVAEPLLADVAADDGRLKKSNDQDLTSIRTDANGNLLAKALYNLTNPATILPIIDKTRISCRNFILVMKTKVCVRKSKFCEKSLATFPLTCTMHKKSP